jgi:hypothetical protein
MRIANDDTGAQEECLWRFTSPGYGRCYGIYSMNGLIFFKEGFMVTWVGYSLSVTFLNWVAQFEDML